MAFLQQSYILVAKFEIANVLIGKITVLPTEEQVRNLLGVDATVTHVDCFTDER